MKIYYWRNPIKKINSYIQQSRERGKLSRQKLAKLCGVSRQYIHCIEAGEFVPSAGLCLKLALHLKLDHDVVLLSAGHVPPDVLTLLQEHPREGCELLRRELLALMER